MKLFILIYNLSFLLVGLLELQTEASTLPKDWQGKWWQWRVGEVYISPNIISEKGECIESRLASSKLNRGNSYKLLMRKSIQCYRCLFVVERKSSNAPLNVLQYRESHTCVNSANLDEACSKLSAESQLHTLIKLNFTSTRCQFAKNLYDMNSYYLYNYNYEPCLSMSDPSSMSVCADKRSVEFDFKKCSYDWYSSSFIPKIGQEKLRMECLADWSSDDDMTLVRITNRPNWSLDKQFRCLMRRWQWLNDEAELRLTLSEDASCSIYGIDDGFLMLTLSKALSRGVLVQGKSAPIFPVWISSAHWNNSASMSFLTSFLENGQIVLRLQSGDNNQAVLRLNRVHFLNDSFVGGTSFSTVGCDVGYQCFSAFQAAPGVLLLKLGKVTPLLTDCTNFQPDIRLTLFDYKSLQRRPCPFTGEANRPLTKPSSVSSSSSCFYSVQLGCSQPGDVIHGTICSDDQDDDWKQKPLSVCSSTWSEYERNITVLLNRSPYLQRCLVTERVSDTDDVLLSISTCDTFSVPPTQKYSTAKCKSSNSRKKKESLVAKYEVASNSQPSRIKHKVTTFFASLFSVTHLLHRSVILDYFPR